MKTGKYFSTMLIITFLTVIIVLLPEVVMIGKTVTKNNYETSWEYTNSEPGKLTPEQFVVLYTNGGVAFNPLLYESYFTSDEDEIVKEVKLKLKELFGSESTLTNYFCNDIKEITYHQKRSALTLFMDEMIALKFTEVMFGNNVTLVYEEKTGVITEFSCVINHKLAKSVADAVDSYYNKIVGADYYSYHYIEKKIVDEGYFFSFGLEPTTALEKDKKAEAEAEYTN